MALHTLPVIDAFNEIVELVVGVIGFCLLSFDLRGERVLDTAAASDNVVFFVFLWDSPKDSEVALCIAIN